MQGKEKHDVLKENLKERFEIVSEITADRAYRGRDNFTNCDVFIKVGDEEDARITREITALNMVDSPFVPKFVCSFTDGGKRYLVEQWISGETLANILGKCSKLEPVCALKVAEHICDALSYLHWNKNGEIAYLDLKPSNVMIDGSLDSGIFGVTLLDLESAVRTQDVPMDVSDETTVVVSDHYSAPEILFGRASALCDIYSLGVVITKMLVGVELLETPELLPPDLEFLVEKMTASNSCKRFKNIADVKAAISDIRHRREKNQRSSANKGKVHEIGNVNSVNSGNAKERQRENVANRNNNQDKDGRTFTDRDKNYVEETNYEHSHLRDLNSVSKSKTNVYSECIQNAKHTTILVEYNSRFACEMAQTATEKLGYTVGVFAISAKGQRNLEFHLLNQWEEAELEMEPDIFPFLLNHRSIYERNVPDWLSRRLLYECSEKLYMGTSQLMMEIPMRNEHDADLFMRWCSQNFDLALFTVEHKDDPAPQDLLRKCVDKIIVTPSASANEVRACKQYYKDLEETGRVNYAKIRFATWDDANESAADENWTKRILGKNNMIGTITKKGQRSLKKNRISIAAPGPGNQGDASEYEEIVRRLVS